MSRTRKLSTTEFFLSYHIIIFFYPYTHPLTSGVVGMGTSGVVGMGIYMNVSFFLSFYI